jgi:hypothetical protein
VALGFFHEQCWALAGNSVRVFWNEEILMVKVLVFGLWSLVALGLAAIVLISGYAVQNGAGHTSLDPFIALVLFVPLVFAGALGFILRRKFPGMVRVSVCALVVGVAGVALIVTLDRTNRLVQYDRWIKRGMP